MRVLVTGAGGPAGRAVTTLLHARGVDVVAADMAPVAGAPVPVSRVPAAADPAFLPALRELVRAEGIGLVVPTVSEELPVIAAAAAEWVHGCEVVIAGADAVAVADDKLRTAEVLRAAGVPVPRFARPEQFASVGDATALWGVPVVVKPRISRGGRGVQTVSSDRDVSWPTVSADHIVQEFAPGVEYAPMVFRPRGTGAQGVTVVLEKVSLAGGHIGNATAVRRVEAPDVAEVAWRAVAALGLTGPVDVDVRRDVLGRPVVLEVNARFGANSTAAPEVLEAMLAERGLAVGSEA
ncbi:ATP-grasp domain-containing protein [Ruania halotolerans]|uniref:ATP-grasp domain-containing protein n=1 Tax=Ruania halotolerans TaxID=2897773 RepID=UPI001E34733C|nr:ATP-grasp domain-containing protein [Ruania halotolerans]UFU06790.1 ATP-grasp domain-containing protein [Ruania halotolerans]